MCQHNRKISQLVGLVVFTWAMVLVSYGSAQAADCTWDGSSGNWANSARWNCGIVPGSGDKAIIDAGEVTLNAAVTVSGLTMNGGALQGSANLSVLDAMIWSAGSIAGSTSSSLTVGTGATLTLDGQYGGKTLDGRALQQNGTATWTIDPSAYDISIWPTVGSSTTTARSPSMATASSMTTAAATWLSTTSGRSPGPVAAKTTTRASLVCPSTIPAQ